MRRYLRAKTDFCLDHVVVGAAYPWLRDCNGMVSFLNREIDEGDSGLEEKYGKHTITTTVDDGAGRKLEDWRPRYGDFVVCGPGNPLMVVDAWCEGTLRVLDVDIKHGRVKDGEYKPAVHVAPQVFNLASVYRTLPNGVGYVASFPMPFPYCVCFRFPGLPDGVLESDMMALAHMDFYASLAKYHEEGMEGARKKMRC